MELKLQGRDDSWLVVTFLHTFDCGDLTEHQINTSLHAYAEERERGGRETDKPELLPKLSGTT